MKRNYYYLIAKISFVILPLLAFSNIFGSDNRFSTPLTGMEEVPPVNTNSTGVAIFELINNNTLNFKINVTNMDNIKAGHIHLGEFGQNGEILVTLFKSETPKDIINGTLVEGKVVAANLQGSLKGKTIPDLVNLVNNTKTYVNIHSVEYPKGEIRGEITTVNATNWWN